MNKVIAFCGSKGSGKSTSCELFKQWYKGEVEEAALAGHLKLSCSKVFGVSIDNFMIPSLKEVELNTYINLTQQNLEQLFKEFNIESFTYDDNIRPYIGKVLTTPRKLLQYVGTEVLHKIDPLIHTKTIVKNKDPNKVTIITDLRFVNEFNFLNDNFKDCFIPFYVKNNRAELIAQGDTHASERELLLFRDKCKLLSNNLNISDLEFKIREIVKELED